MASESLLRAYAGRGRPNPLVLVDADDELYSATLPLAKVYYCWIDPRGLVQQLAPHYVYLGITVTAGQFEELERWRPVFRERLRSWGLDSGDPIATSIVADSDADVPKVIAAHPDYDFYLPARLRPALQDAFSSTDEIVAGSDQRWFLLAKQTPAAVAAPPKLVLPAKW